MARLILPVVLLILGLAAGVGAGLLLKPEAPVEEVLADGMPAEDCVTGTTGLDDDGLTAATGLPRTNRDVEGVRQLSSDPQYVRLPNQFIVPVLRDGSVVFLVIVALSIEVPSGQSDAVLAHEPRLRDVFLQVLFDHANTGGFDGDFTSASQMRTLRNGLRVAARDALGDAITDVLIVNLVRQDS
jgi:flagellar FliL protein